MRKAHPYGVQGRRPVADRYTRAKKEKKIEAIRKWAKQMPAEEKLFAFPIKKTSSRIMDEVF